jgi:hypothetical protein
MLKIKLTCLTVKIALKIEQDNTEKWGAALAVKPGSFSLTLRETPSL